MDSEVVEARDDDEHDRQRTDAMEWITRESSSVTVDSQRKSKYFHLSLSLSLSLCFVHVISIALQWTMLFVHWTH